MAASDQGRPMSEIPSYYMYADEAKNRDSLDATTHDLANDDGGASGTNELMRELMAENKRMREELLSAIRNEMAPKTSETEPLYDTLDDEGNIVTAPPWRVEEQVTFSAGRGAVNIIKSRWQQTGEE